MTEHPELNLPPRELKLREEQGRRYALDTQRNRWVVLTPEEWVRLHVVEFLISQRNVPRGLVAVEAELEYAGSRRRADIVVYDRNGHPALIVECKAPTVKLNQQVVDQVARYNYALGAGMMMVTNGLEHFIIRIEGKSHVYLDDLPEYSRITSNGGEDRSRARNAGR